MTAGDKYCAVHGWTHCSCPQIIHPTFLPPLPNAPMEDPPSPNKIFNFIPTIQIIEQRKYLPTLAELIDRLSIAQLKEVFIPEHKEEYAQEIKDIVHDIQLILDEQDGKITAQTIRALVVLSQMNLHIWHNESNYRKGIKEGNQLELTHGLNGIRNVAKNKIQEIVGGRKDYKIDCLAAEFKDWDISWDKE